MANHRDLPPAPDYEPGWPSGAERMGPAWNVIYWAIPNDIWVRPADIISEYRSHVGLAPSTIRGMLNDALRAGLLETRTVRINRKKAKQIRRTRSLPGERTDLSPYR